MIYLYVAYGKHFEQLNQKGDKEMFKIKVWFRPYRDSKYEEKTEFGPFQTKQDAHNFLIKKDGL